MNGKFMLRKIYRLLFIIITLFCYPLSNFAQSDYVSCVPSEDNDCIGDIDGKGGVLIIANRSDLVINVTNASQVVITPKGKRSDGKYAYEVVVDMKETVNPKIEVHRRGDINKADFVTTLKPNIFKAYEVVEVQKPIRMENQTKPNDVILDAKLAEVEITSVVPNLKVVCSDYLGATISQKQDNSDKNLQITSIIIPIENIKAAKEELSRAQKTHDDLHKKLIDDVPEGATSTASDDEWELLNKYEENVEKAKKKLSKMGQIEIYAPETNKLYIDISDIGPRSKLCYGVLLLKTIEKVYVSECSAMLAEGARHYSMREYEAAKNAFSNALTAKDTPADMKDAIRTSINQCDTCILYEKYALGALSKLKKLRNEPAPKQSDVAKYAIGASEFLQVLNKYNESDFYTSRIEKLNDIVEQMPLDIKFTVTKWVNNYGEFYEVGGISNVEVWAYNGNVQPPLEEYMNDKRLTKFLESTSKCTLAGTTDDKGHVDLHFNRKNLPKGLFFRPIGYKNKIKIKYMDISEMLEKSKQSYDKAQIRIKMYCSY